MGEAGDGTPGGGTPGGHGGTPGDPGGSGGHGGTPGDPGGSGGSAGAVRGSGGAPSAELADGATPAAGRAFLRLVLVGAAIGVPAAFVAAGFLALVHYLEDWLWDDLPGALGHTEPPWYLVLGLPVVGALVVLTARRLLPGDGGHRPLEGLSVTPTPVSHAPGVALAALGTLPFGAVLGPEAPVMALGSVVGVAASRLLRLGSRPTTMLSGAGSFAAISALFNGPIVAGMLFLEGGLAAGTALLPALVPGVVAAAVGYVIFIGFGSWGGLDAPGIQVPNLPAYSGVHLYDLLVAIAVGILAALVVTAVHACGRWIETVRRRLGLAGLLAAGGLAIGALAELAGLAGVDPKDVLFSGQSAIPVLVAQNSLGTLLVLAVAKFLAYVVSIGCGYRGGPIFPAVFLGVALASVAVVVFGVSPTLAIAIGAAAGMAAQARLLFSPLIFAALLVGTAGAGTVSAGVLASAAAWLTMHARGPRPTPVRP
ncbi:MAG TPA: chloride channel protein [Actinocatenispora sp.]